MSIFEELDTEKGLDLQERMNWRGLDGAVAQSAKNINKKSIKTKTS